jgi:hypothetical protein
LCGWYGADVRTSDVAVMVITVVIRVPDPLPTVPLSILLAIAEPGLVGVARALGFGPVAPLVVGAICREAERRFELVGA